MIKEEIEKLQGKSDKMRPELLAPAGDSDKLKIALLYGADAIYIGAKSFGLRSAAGNFNIEELVKAIDYTHRHGRKIYLVVNTHAHNDEINELIKFLTTIKPINLDALIVSDAGVLRLAKEITDYEIHLSTQASAINYEAAKFWKNYGVDRIILGRETSIKEACEIYEKGKIDVEIFIHGSMCMSYSGKCTISNFLSLRDANRGGCTNSCRWEYIRKDNGETFYPLNSRDLWAIEQIPEIITNNKICSLKIEGRMKNALYLANTISAYRKAIDYCYEGYINQTFDKKSYEEMLPSLKKQLYSNVNRTFTNGFLKKVADGDSILYDNREKKSAYDNLGTVIEKLADNEFLIDIKNPCKINDEIEILIPMKNIEKRKITKIKNMAGEIIQNIPNNRLAYIFIDKIIPENIPKFTTIRKLVGKSL